MKFPSKPLNNLHVTFSQTLKVRFITDKLCQSGNFRVSMMREPHDDSFKTPGVRHVFQSETGTCQI